MTALLDNLQRKLKNGINITILIVDGGGRGSALAQACAMSSCVRRVICAPGNAGTREGDRFNVKETDLPGIYKIVVEQKVDFVIVGPEAALAVGLCDYLHARSIPVFGPTQAAAMLETSKVFMKEFCLRNNIPTANYYIADSYADLRRVTLPNFLVVKADGLAGGKGVTVANDLHGVFTAAKAAFNGAFGDAGKRLVIEEKLVGRECSFMFICDGENAVPMPTVQDYKRALDGDQGLNTGGMGAISPAPGVDEQMVERVRSEIVLPTLNAMAKAETPFHGILYAGVMLTSDGPKLMEYNVRFGDPEIEAIVPRLLLSDLVEYMIASVESGGLAKLQPLTVSNRVTVCMFAVSDGYPGRYETGFSITGIEEAEKDAYVFHAGTTRKDGNVVTSGGRVIAVVANGSTFENARKRCLVAIKKLYFKNMFIRTDIAAGLID
jgi:phosphoribosylamine--glycine ligase